MNEVVNAISNVLDEFDNVNKNEGIDIKEHVIITGSSCGAYMNYIDVPVFKDVDVYVLGSIHPLLVSRVDILRRICLLEGWQERLIVKDGWKFLSPIDLLMQETFGALVQKKPSTMRHAGALLQYLGLTPEECADIFTQTLYYAGATNKKLVQSEIDTLLEDIKHERIVGIQKNYSSINS